MPRVRKDIAIAQLLPDNEFVGVVVTARVMRDATGVYEEVPAVMTNRGVIGPLLEYCCSERGRRSQDWLSKLCHACLLFIRYASANRGMDDEQLFRTFATRRYSGTFVPETGVDQSWLCWRPVSLPTAKRTVSQLTTYFTATRNGKTSTAPEATTYDVFMRRASYAHAREKAMLGHTWEANPSAESVKGSVSPLPRTLNSERGDAIGFPDEKFMDLLFKGWCSRGRLSARDGAITVLLNGGGPRTSEPFHMYVTDVSEDPLNPGSAIFLIHHPVEGRAPEDWLDPLGRPRSGNRQAYLKERWGLEPKTQVRGTRHSGFKGARMEKKHGGEYFRVQWFPPQFGVIFMHFWRRYLVDLVSVDRSHPYAFVNLTRGERGDVYKLSAFRQAHADAVQRIGLTPSRLDGFAPHCHRHAYGNRLAEAGMDGDEIMLFMHHRNSESHRVYTRPRQQQMVRALHEAHERQKNLPSIQKWNGFADEVEYRLRST